MTTTTDRLVLIIGADGGIGAETAKAFNAQGWQVRALKRSPAKASSNDWRGPITCVAGDAMRAGDVLAAVQGASVIFHGANPPNYQNWRGLAIPMLQSAIAAAKATGARLMMSGNVYNYGPDTFPLLTETSPEHPLTRKGQVRVEMEEMMESAASEGARSLILRAGDFFGPHQPTSWLKDLMVTPGKPVTSVIYPGKPEIGHAWAYLPDLAETFARLASLESAFPVFERFHFGGHWVEPGIDFAKAVARAGGNPSAPIRPLPMWFHMATPFVGFLREAREMRYLWDRPVRLDNAKLARRIGAEPHTPLLEALTATLSGFGCLPVAKQAEAA